MPSNDIRYALRLMRRGSGFTAVAVLSLALGIGANTAIYSLLYTVMLRPLPVAHPGELVEFLRTTPEEPRSDGYWGWEKYEYFRDHNHVLAAVTGTTFDNLAAVRAGQSDVETLVLEGVAGNYFQVLGLKPALGRLIGPGDMPAAGEGDAVVVSWSYWKRRLGGDPAAAGRRLWYDDAPKTVIGVAPPTYTGPRVGARTDIWMPRAGDVAILGRLKPGVALARAEAEMNVLYREWRASNGAVRNPKAPQPKIELEPAGAGMVRIRGRYGKALVLVMVAVGLLLLLACVNLAGLLLARAAGRRRELAVRVGLGAGRWRLVRQMLTESLLLAGVGTLAGVPAAYFGIAVLVRITAGGRAFERVEIQVHPDMSVLLFTAAIGLLTGLLFGLAPAWYAFRAAPVSALRQTGKGGETRFWRWFGQGLVSVQVALSLLLVTSAAWFLGHLARLRDFNLGFRSDHVLLVTVDPEHRGYSPQRLAVAYRELLGRFERIPGVRSASVTGCAPLEGCGSGARFLFAEGHVEPPEERLRTTVTFIGPRYFETLGIPLAAGRDFDFADKGRPRVAIVNRAMARHYFPGGSPIGKRFRVDSSPQSGSWFGTGEPYEIVGLAGDAKAIELRDPPYPTAYFNMFQENQFHDQFALRTAVDPESVAGAVERVVRDGLHAVPIARITTLAAQVDSNLVPEHLIATLSEFFGGLGAVLAGIGFYGLLAYSVARRTGEIGIRMALGATAGQVSRLVLRDALAMTGVGLAAGAALVFWARPLAAGLLHDLKWQGAAPLAAGGGTIAFIALAAALIPARRAVRVDPIAALRHE